MRPNTSPLAQQYKCRCGETHAKMFKLFNLNVYLCPEVTDDALHFVYLPPPGVSYLVTGPEGTASRSADALKGLEARVAALEALAKRVTPSIAPSPKSLDAVGVDITAKTGKITRPQ